MTNTTTAQRTTPQQLVEELYQDYLRTIASPLPTDPAAFGWQMNASAAFSGFALALHHLAKADPVMAREVVAWWKREDDDNFGPEEGPNPVDFQAWAMAAIARTPQRYERWVAEAREAAERAAAA